MAGNVRPFHRCPVWSSHAVWSRLDVDNALCNDWYVDMCIWGIFIGLFVHMRCLYRGKWLLLRTKVTVLWSLLSDFEKLLFPPHTVVAWKKKLCWHSYSQCFHLFSHDSIPPNTYSIIFTCQMFHMVTSAQTICTGVPATIMSYIIELRVKSLLVLVSERLLHAHQVKWWLPQVFTSCQRRSVHNRHLKCTCTYWANQRGVILSFNGCPRPLQPHCLIYAAGAFLHKILIRAAAR